MCNNRIPLVAKMVEDSWSFGKERENGQFHGDTHRAYSARVACTTSLLDVTSKGLPDLANEVVLLRLDV